MSCGGFKDDKLSADRTVSAVPIFTAASPTNNAQPASICISATCRDIHILEQHAFEPRFEVSDCIASPYNIHTLFLDMLPVVVVERVGNCHPGRLSRIQDCLASRKQVR